jgi:hypothetical protein
VDHPNTFSGLNLEFGGPEEVTTTLFVLAIGVTMGHTLNALPNTEAPEAEIAKLWRAPKLRLWMNLSRVPTPAACNAVSLPAICIAQQCRGQWPNQSAARSGGRPEVLSLDEAAPALPPLSPQRRAYAGSAAVLVPSAEQSGQSNPASAVIGTAKK